MVRHRTIYYLVPPKLAVPIGLFQPSYHATPYYQSQYLVCAEVLDTGCSGIVGSLWRMRRAVEGRGVHRMLSHQNNLYSLNQTVRGCAELQSTPRLTDESWIAFS